MILLLTPLHVHKLRSISGRLHSLCSPHGQFHELDFVLLPRLSIFRNYILDYRLFYLNWFEQLFAQQVTSFVLLKFCLLNNDLNTVCMIKTYKVRTETVLRKHFPKLVEESLRISDFTLKRFV